jgi:hypothetical protein
MNEHIYFLYKGGIRNIYEIIFNENICMFLYSS